MTSYANPTQSRARTGSPSNLSVGPLFDLLFFSLILAAPLVVFGFYTGGISLRLSRLLIILTTPVMFWIAATRPELFIRDRFLVFGILPYLLYTSLSIMWSPNVETGTGRERLGGLYEVVLLYLIFVAADLNTQRFYKFVKFYVFSAIVPLAFSIWQLLNNIFSFSPAELPFGGAVIPGKYDLLEGRAFVTEHGFSRISSTFAEPVIFSSYICSVILMSLILEHRSRMARVALRSFQAVAFIIMALSVSKLSLLSLVVGLLFISMWNRKYGLLAGMVCLSVGMFAVMSYYDLLSVFNRLLISTGHKEKLLESLAALKESSLVFGEGIGSIPFGSWHRFVVSRVYESGIVGMYFVIFISSIPFVVGFRPAVTDRARQVRNICTGVLLVTILGLHLYDYFIHLFPWIVISAIVSFHNSERYLQRKRPAQTTRRRTPTIVGPSFNGPR